jgi:hypothetical protein
MVLGTADGRGGDLVPEFQADGYPEAAKPSQPEGIGLVCAAATKERGNLR